jgi:hypothetical protein
VSISALALEQADVIQISKIRSLLCGAAAVAIALPTAVLAQQAKLVATERAQLTDWATVQNARYGFMIAYPGNVFEPRASKAEIEGQVLVSRDGAAQLVVATFENEGQASMAEYRQQILEQNYRGASLDFAPVKKNWFIVSGTRGNRHFYERVSFTCGGRLINSWALLYPSSARQFYDRVVEAVARTYSPGAGRTGRCD